jgi:hypothetical protein
VTLDWTEILFSRIRIIGGATSNRFLSFGKFCLKWMIEQMQFARRCRLVAFGVMPGIGPGVRAGWNMAS